MIDARTSAIACAACEAPLQGRYCHACGQDSAAVPRPFLEWASEAFSETSLVDGRTARTFVALIRRPGRLLDAFRDGASSRYQSLTKMFVVATALFLLALSLSDVALYQYVVLREDPTRGVLAQPDPDGTTVHLTNVSQGELWMQKRVDTPIDPVVTEALHRAADAAGSERDRQNLLYEIQTNREQFVIGERLSGWLPNALWLLMPLYALLLAPLFGRQRLIVEHLIFAMWAHVMAFGMLALLAVANGFGARWQAWPLVLPLLVYLTVAASRYYALTWPRAAWRAVVHTGLYVVLVLMPAAVVVAITAMDLKAFGAFLAAV